MSPKKRSRFVAYCRVSTVEQATEGVSLAAQRQKLEAWAVLHEIDLVEIVVDEGVSATAPLADRPGGARVLELLQNGDAEGLVFAKLDRVFRSTADAVLTVDRVFRKHGWQLVSLAEQLDTTTSMGRFLLRMFASLAELERDRLSERTSEALQHLRQQGVRVGRARYGERYSDDVDDEGHRVVVAVPEQQKTIRRAKALRAKGATLQQIADQLTAEGRPTQRGGSWAPKTVRDLLQRAD